MQTTQCKSNKSSLVSCLTTLHLGNIEKDQYGSGYRNLHTSKSVINGVMNSICSIHASWLMTMAEW